MKQLEKQFDGTGQMSNFKFKQISSTIAGFLYEVTENGTNVHYEVFEAKKAPLCIDFEKRLYSETEFKEVYPKDKDFGVWAWCIRDKQKAINKFNNL